ncbi:hypothetical protein Pint_28016 [Pistacia integerrima]|uniref:Uncharacterized protein n=1 Tax=Pistacia integerrima TaxID=434235 RepID=A0ACC0YNZ7_9ROSI|nr:hypothetical protein Pint_28016 [Pistacia integerrima]
MFVQILAMDINLENYELCLPIIQKAGVVHKIDFSEGLTLPFLYQMIQEDGVEFVLDCVNLKKP